jgi:hypothetical protein
LNGTPVTYSLVASDRTITWPKTIVWTTEPPPPAPTPGTAVIPEWPDGFAEAYEADLLALDGEMPAVFPISGRTVRFVRKNNLQTDNQLGDLVAYLEERYAQMGLATWRDYFVWRGMTQTNLFAEIPGTDPSLDPLLVADHIDTAFAEDLFHQTGLRISVPGRRQLLGDRGAAAHGRRAPDARAGAHDLARPPDRREFPADDLGARALVSRMLSEAAHRRTRAPGHDRVRGQEVKFQLSPGNQAASLHMASVALDAATDVAPEPDLCWRPGTRSGATCTTRTGSSSARTGTPSY